MGWLGSVHNARVSSRSFIYKHRIARVGRVNEVVGLTVLLNDSIVYRLDGVAA